MLNHIFYSFHSPGGKHLCLLSLSLSFQWSRCVLVDLLLKAFLRTRCPYFLFAIISSCVVVSFNRSCLFEDLFVLLTYSYAVNMISSHLEFVSRHQRDLADIIIKTIETYSSRIRMMMMLMMRTTTG